MTVTTVSQLIDVINQKNPDLIIISGIPGSGKTTLAHNLVASINRKCVHYEADQYFETSNGYNFNANKLGIAHNTCQTNTRNSLEEGICTIVSNTFTQDWELKPYIGMNKNYIIIQMTGDYGNIHGCPEYSVQRLKERLKTRKTKPHIICDKNINKTK